MGALNPLILIGILAYLIFVSIVWAAAYFIFYYAVMSLGYKKLAKWLFIMASVVLTVLTIYMMPRERVMTKELAIEMLKDEGIQLADSFSINEHYYDWGMGEHFEWFTLTISRSDKERLIKQIKESKGYDKSLSNCTDVFAENYKSGVACEDDNYIMRTTNPVFSGYITIKVSKDSNQLYFEDLNL